MDAEDKLWTALLIIMLVAALMMTPSIPDIEMPDCSSDTECMELYGGFGDPEPMIVDRSEYVCYPEDNPNNR